VAGGGFLATAGIASPAAAAGHGHRDLVDSWLRLWNGDHARAEKIIAAHFRTHAAMMDGGDGSVIDGPAAMVGWISQTHAAFDDLRFAIEVGPIRDGDHLSLRWRATGTYAGGFPGAQAPVGTRVDFTGTDTLRIHRGMLAEYWVNSDTLLLIAQLRVGS
jgi:predicted ester cyclase